MVLVMHQDLGGWADNLLGCVIRVVREMHLLMNAVDDVRYRHHRQLLLLHGNHRHHRCQTNHCHQHADHYRIP
jgi:hypothetical protein